MSELISLIDKLNTFRSLSLEEYERLIAGRNDEAAAYARTLADRARREFYGNSVFVRGLIEIGNVCRNDCLYCGIRRSNAACSRYVLTREQIMDCCAEGYALGFRTFVLQGGENVKSADEICETVKAIRKEYPDCAITLSLGEYSRADYARMREAGADRYLLRHETADKAHYEKLHPSGMSFDNRMRCLRDLKELGFQVELRLGAEVAIEQGISDLPQIRALTITGTDLILLELPYAPYQSWMEQEVHAIAVQQGLTPVIAHVHRYLMWYSQADLETVLGWDAIFQINAEAFESFRQKRIVKELLKRGLPVLFGSDCHNLSDRRPNFDFLLRKAKPELLQQADRLFAQHILSYSTAQA